jgi:hypothetical protein
MPPVTSHHIRISIAAESKDSLGSNRWELYPHTLLQLGVVSPYTPVRSLIGKKGLINIAGSCIPIHSCSWELYPHTLLQRHLIEKEGLINDEWIMLREPDLQ